MSEFRFSYPACVIAGKSLLTAQDIAILRTIALPRGVQCETDIVSLLAINNSCREKCPEWTDYFTAVIADFVLNRLAPRGQLDDAKAGLVQRLFATAGLIGSTEELALVLALIEHAPRAPESLIAFALDQVRHALQSGQGAYADSRKASAGINPDDLAYIARVLDAASDDRRDTLSPLAATVLMAIDSVAVSVFNHAGWSDLIYALRGPQSADAPCGIAA